MLEMRFGSQVSHYYYINISINIDGAKKDNVIHYIFNKNNKNFNNSKILKLFAPLFSMSSFCGFFRIGTFWS